MCVLVSRVTQMQNNYFSFTVSNTVVKRGRNSLKWCGSSEASSWYGISQKFFVIQPTGQANWSTAAIGYIRYATAGEASVDNIQPFLFRFHDNQFGLASRTTNAESLRRELEKMVQSLTRLLTQKFWPWFVVATLHQLHGVRWKKREHC